MSKWKNLKKIILIAFLAAIGARLYVSFFVDGFIITFTAIILAISLYFNDDVHPLALGIVVAIVSPGMRFAFESFTSPDVLMSVNQIYPDIFFYLTYGLVFYLFRKYLGHSFKSKFYLVAFFTDFLSNLAEMLVRTKIFDITWFMIEGIVLVAIGRTLITLLSIYFIVRYSTLLMRQAHEKRYQYLMMQSSRFKSEIYFLHKNMNQIESLMSLSHQIKRKVSDDLELKELTLDLSKGIHEIKKDYIRVVRGLEEIYDGGMNLDEISMKDLFQIIEVSTEDYIRSRHLNVICRFKCKVNIMVKDHFYLMSILRNLVNNSIDACGSQGIIDVYAHEVEDLITIYVRDNGIGISEDDRTFIFNTGYSTKFNEDTGDIYRGLGLTLVKEMVENVFEGNITYESELNKGTTFILNLSPQVLQEGSEDEILHS